MANYMTPAKRRSMQAMIDNCSNDELNMIVNMIKERRDVVYAKTAAVFSVNDKVKFNRGPRRGGWVNGVVKKVNRKTVKVKVADCMWTVSPTLLEAA